MSDLLHTLVQYADSTCELPQSYWDTLRALCAGQSELSAGLTGTQQAQLEELLETENALHTIDAETLFCRGLAMGLELARLTSPRTRPRTPCR